MLSHSSADTGCTVTATVSVSLSAPPGPVLPRSSVEICTLALPMKPGVATKVAPASAALMSAMVPVKVMVASAVPSPVLKVSPWVPDRFSVPLVAVRVTWTGFVPASRSLTDSAVPMLDENSSMPSWSMVCAPGAMFSGASLLASSRLFRSIVTVASS